MCSENIFTILKTKAVVNKNIPSNKVVKHFYYYLLTQRWMCFDTVAKMILISIKNYLITVSMSDIRRSLSLTLYRTVLLVSDAVKYRNDWPIEDTRLNVNAQYYLGHVEYVWGIFRKYVATIQSSREFAYKSCIGDSFTLYVLTNLIIVTILF